MHLGVMRYKLIIMKKYMLLLVVSTLTLTSFCQLTITSGGQWVNTGNTIATLRDIDLVNNGTFTAGNSVIKFTGSSSNTIGGSSVTSFNELEINKPGNGKIILLTNATVSSKVNFITGLLELNQKDLTLASSAFLDNENESSRITGANGGEVQITLTMNTPNSMNPGNLGAIITSSSNLGSVTIRRGHKVQSGTGLINSITRYFDIQPSNNNNLNATFRYQYFDAELTSQSENMLEMFRSTDNGTSWATQSYNTRNTALNYVEKTGIPAFSKWTLSTASGPLPITGLELYAKRISNTQVELDWKTIQEINNHGFHIERKKENENSFADMGFVPSNASGGNSSFPLQYQKLDNNNFTGNTYYRLKQEDIDGRSTYSVVRVVKGDESKRLTMQVWPVPAVNFFNVSVSGIDKPDAVQVFDMNGRMIKSFVITNQSQQQVYGLPAGAYYIKLGSDKTVGQKVIVQ